MAGGYNQVKVIQLFLGCMSGIYLFAFISVYKQIPGLYGETGIYPAAYILEDKSICEDTDENCYKWAAAGHCTINPWMTVNCAKSCKSCKVGIWKFLDFPTVLWVTPYFGLTTETGMELTCLLAMSICVTMLISPKSRDCISFFALWFLYYSLVQVGQIFLYYQWDSLLLEVGFLSIIVAPWNLLIGLWNIFHFRRIRSFGRAHDGVTFWLVKWLFFRLMFASGVVKLLWQDEAWWNLTALNWHYESQCIPSPLAWYMQKLPVAFHRFSTVMTYFIEIGVPILFFAPFRALRIFSFYCQLLLQLLIIMTGNYNFFNFLTIVLSLSLLDDSSCQCSVKHCCVRRKAKHESKVSSVPCNGQSEMKPGDVDIAAVATGALSPSSEGLQISKEPFKYDRSAWSIAKDCFAALAEDRIRSKRLSTLKTIAADRKTKMAVTVMKWAIVIAIIFLILGFTAKWSGMNFNKQDLIRVELIFSYDDFFYAVRNSVVWSMGIGLFSLSIEVFAAVIRSIVGCEDLLVKAFCLARTIVFSLIAVWIFGLSLVRFTDLDKYARDTLPKFLIKHYYEMDKFKLVDSYGLFRSMTGIGGRPEIIIMGGNQLLENATWTEYNFMYKPGNLYQAPPINVPHQPRLDWQMWFAALEDYSSNLWFIHLCYKLLLGEKEILRLLGHNVKLSKNPPKYIRTVLYRYHYTLNQTTLLDAIANKKGEKRWWTREYIGEYMPVVERNDKGLKYLLRKFGLIRDDRKMEKFFGPVHSLVLFARNVTAVFRTEVLIFAIFLKVLIVKLVKEWWDIKGSKKSQAKMIGLERETRRRVNQYTEKLEKVINRLPSARIKSKKKDKWSQ